MYSRPSPPNTAALGTGEKTAVYIGKTAVKGVKYNQEKHIWDLKDDLCQENETSSC